MAKRSGITFFPQTLPPGTVVGRLASTPGISEAVTLEQLANSITIAEGAELTGFSHSMTGAAGTVAQKGKQFVFADDAPYLAAGDGATDDYSHLNAAVTAQAGGLLELTYGKTYRLGTAIALPAAGITIEGNGATIKHLGATLHQFFTATSAAKIEIRNVILDGDMTNVSIYAAGRESRVAALQFTTCTDILLKNVEMKAHRGQAIYGTGCGRVRIEHCWLHDTDNWGSVFSASNDVVYFDNHVENVFILGLYCDGASGAGSNRVRFLGNTAINVQNDAAYANSGIGFSCNKTANIVVADIEVIGNTAKGNGAMGFSMTPATTAQQGKLVMVGNISRDHTTDVGYGYEVQGTNITFSGNIAYNNKIGCPIQNVVGMTVTGNHFQGLAASQIGFALLPANVGSPVVDLIVQGNTFLLGTGFQVSNVAAAHNNISVLGNQFIGCDFSVLTQASVTNYRVNGNIIDATGATATLGRGIQITGDSFQCNDNHIRCFTANNQSGISFGAASGTGEIKDNVVWAAAFGISNSFTVTKLTVGGNDVSAAATQILGFSTGITTLIDEATNSWNFAAAQPATGAWHIGQKVRNTGPAEAGGAGNKYVIDSWIRITTGSGNVANTDWLQQRTLTGN